MSYSYVQGTKLGNGTYLNPKDNASRQEAMTMFLRCYKTIQWFYDENVKSATVVVDQINLNVTVTSISKTMYVCQTGYINVRDSWTTGSTKVGELSYNAAVTVTGITTTTSDGHQWYRIKYNGITAYVRADLLADKKDSTVTPGSGSGSGSGGTVSGSGTASEIANFAMGFVGYSYVWGGSSPSTGFDCSGLMYYVLTQYGYSMKRVANDQMTQGTYVSRSDLQVGDLVFFGYSGYANHVGMYIGGGNFVHASTPSTGVRVNSEAHPKRKPLLRQKTQHENPQKSGPIREDGEWIKRRALPAGETQSKDPQTKGGPTDLGGAVRLSFTGLPPRSARGGWRRRRACASPSRAERHGADLRAVRDARALELLLEEAAAERS